MSWRREDAAYAAATTIAAAVVAFVLAGNFGLVVSPLTGSSPLSSDGIGVPVLAIGTGTGPLGTETDATSAPTVPVIPTTPTQPPGVRPPTVAAAGPTLDVQTPDGSIFVRLTDAATIDGTATDVDDVVVTFQPGLGGETTDVAADSTCDGRRCTWSAPVPGVVATYTVSVSARGNDGSVVKADAIQVTVVDLTLPLAQGAEGRTDLITSLV